MGLDMYLEGYKSSWEHKDFEDGFPVTRQELELGYWRKHPDLHGYIVENFADGVDECQSIPLTIDDLDTILTAVEKDCLPHTEGFFFGVSRPEDKAPTIEILKNAIKWLEDKKDSESRSVVYQASW